MTIRTYTAPSMAQALLKVKEDLGASAVVLHTRTYKQGGLLGIGARTVVEVSAADGQQIGRKKAADRQAQRRSVRQRIEQKRAERLTESVESAASTAPSAKAQVQTPADPPMAGELIKQTYRAAMASLPSAPPASPEPPASPKPLNPAALHSEATPSARSVMNTHPGPMPSSSKPPIQTTSTANHTVEVAQQTLPEVRQEMAEVKRLVARVLEQNKQKNNGAVEQLPDNLFDHYRGLIEQELSQELAQEAVEKAQAVLTESQLQDERLCKQAVGRAAANLLTAQAASVEARRTVVDGQPRVIALVGPTGVGKTTTIAKLAATHKLRFGHHVGLITLDTYRIAAVEQLKVYAKIIGLPLHVVTGAEELSRAIRMLAGCDVVLIDTAGRSPNNTERLSELAELMAVAQPHETHLVLSATCSEQAMRKTAERFECVAPDHLIYTKLDEAVSYGSLLSVARGLGKRVSYLTTGQEVPHQIEACRSERLAQLVMDGRLETAPAEATGRMTQAPDASKAPGISATPATPGSLPQRDAVEKPSCVVESASTVIEEDPTTSKDSFASTSSAVSGVIGQSPKGQTQTWAGSQSSKPSQAALLRRTQTAPQDLTTLTTPADPSAVEMLPTQDRTQTAPATNDNPPNRNLATR